MGTGPSKEDLLKLIKTCSKTNNIYNNYQLEFQIDKDNEIYGGDEESLDNDEENDWKGLNIICHNIKEIKRFPYVTIGNITMKFPGPEYFDHTCFIISKNVIVTKLSFLKNGKQNAIEVTTTFSNEKLNLKKCIKFEKKNLAVFSLEGSSITQWIGVDEYIPQKKNIDKKEIRTIFSTGKGTKQDLDRLENIPFLDERNSQGEGIIPFLKEINCDFKSFNKMLEDKRVLKKQIIGGVIYYKNQESGGAYVLGMINENLEPVFFDQDTLKFLYEQVNNSKLSNKTGIDEKHIVELDLSKKNIGPSHIKLLTEFNLVNLKRLNLLKNQIGPQGAFYLGQSKFNNLEILILNFNEIGDEGLQYLSKGPFLGLKYLYLFHNNISNEGVKSILDSIFIDTLLMLDLSDNPNINSYGIEIIKNRMQYNSNVLKELISLNLSATNINDVALEKLRDIDFPKLRTLIMQDIDFSKYKVTLEYLRTKYTIKVDE